jgi:hypothetical protein
VGLTSFDPAPFCAAPRPNQKRSLSIKSSSQRATNTGKLTAAGLAPSGQPTVGEARMTGTTRAPDVRPAPNSYLSQR